MLEILERIVAGNGEMSDLDELEELADMSDKYCLMWSWKECTKAGCKLPIHAFRKEYEEHVDTIRNVVRDVCS